MSLRLQRLLLILVSIIMIFAAVLLILYNGRENISYFYTPSELASLKIDINKKVRLGGFVEKDSFIKITASSFKFKISDDLNSINVTYQGILPDLFREGQGAVIEGYMSKINVLNATSVFAKHDENYIPASIKKEMEGAGYWNKNY